MTNIPKSELFHNIQSSVSLIDSPSLSQSPATIAVELFAYVCLRLGEEQTPDILILIHRYATLAMQFPAKEITSVLNNVAILSTDPPSSVTMLTQWLSRCPSRIQYLDSALSADDVFTSEQLLATAYSLWAERALLYTKEFLLSKALYV